MPIICCNNTTPRHGTVSDLVTRCQVLRSRAHKRESIEAHLSIVLAALAVSRYVEDATDWSIKKFVRTVRRYRTIEIQAGAHTVTAEQPLPDDVRAALEAIHRRAAGH